MHFMPYYIRIRDFDSCDCLDQFGHSGNISYIMLSQPSVVDLHVTST